jgi:hypothetical protein
MGPIKNSCRTAHIYDNSLDKAKASLFGRMEGRNLLRNVTQEKVLNFLQKPAPQPENNSSYSSKAFVMRSLVIAPTTG